MVRFDPYIRIGPRALTLPVAKVIAEVFVVRPSVKDAIESAADETARPTSSRLKAGAAVNPVALKDVSSTAPVVLIARPAFVEVTSKTSARRRIEADEEVTTDEGVWPSLRETVPPWENLPPARSTNTDTEPDPESS